VRGGPSQAALTLRNRNETRYSGLAGVVMSPHAGESLFAEARGMTLPNWDLLDTTSLPCGRLESLADALCASVTGPLAAQCARLSPHEGLPPGVVVGSPRASRRLVVTSGLHGVEGRFGLLLQARFLEQLAKYEALERGDVAVVVLFALNRSGFLNARRWCDANTDLNRAFARPTTQTSETTGNESAGTHGAWKSLYQAFGPAAPSPSLPRFLGASVKNILHYGWRNLFEGLPQGQDVYPDFIFFRDPARAVGVEAIRTRLAEVSAGASELLHIDLHTGLGRAGEAKLLAPTGPLVAACGELGSAYAAPGTLVDGERRRWSEIGGGRGDVERALSPYEGAVLEFGTVSGLRVFFSLLQENHSFQCDDVAANFEHRTALLQNFFPVAPQWRAQATQAGLGVLARALKTLMRLRPESQGQEI
jgi:hypothetical protein